MNDPAINNLLRWGVENSAASQNGDAPAAPKTQLDPNAFAALFGGGKLRSEPEQMTDLMAIIEDEKSNATLDDRMDAFADLELLLGKIDNANVLDALKLWTPLVEKLEHNEPTIRKGAAWCAGTAVENNPSAQERLLVLGALPTLVKLATQDEDMDVRKKAIRALSCATRNFQPGLNTVVEHVPPQYKPKGKLDAGDMSHVDSIIAPLRAAAGQT